MKIKSTFFYLFIASICFNLGSCNSSETPINPPAINTSSTTNIQNNTINNNLAYFLEQSQTVEPGTTIPPELSERFIKPALANSPLHPYLPMDKATYNYGQIIYEDSTMVALTFYYKAIHGKNLLAASFLATYNPITEAFIDARMVFGSSTFDFQATKGYDMGYACKSDMEFLESDRIVLRLKSKVKQLYSHFKEGVSPKSNAVKIHRYSLLKSGEFVFE